MVVTDPPERVDLDPGRKAKMLQCVYLVIKYVQEITGQIINDDITIIARDIPNEQKRSVPSSGFNSG